MKTLINSGSIYIVAWNEFNKVIRHPLLYIIVLIVLVIIVLNGLGYSHIFLPELDRYSNQDVFLIHGMGQIFHNLSLYSTIFAVFIGVLMIGEERFNGSLSILLSKPLYRRDIIIGKFAGTSIFLLLFILIEYFVSAFLVMVFFREPLSMQEFILRSLSNILALYLECSLTLVITMLLGVIFKELLVALIASITFLYVDWYTNLVQSLSVIKIISPHYLYFTIISGNSQGILLDTSVPYGDWLSATLPFIILMLLEIIIFLLINCSLFSKGDEL